MDGGLARTIASRRRLGLTIAHPSCWVRKVTLLRIVCLLGSLDGNHLITPAIYSSLSHATSRFPSPHATRSRGRSPSYLPTTYVPKTSPPIPKIVPKDSLSHPYAVAAPFTLPSPALSSRKSFLQSMTKPLRACRLAAGLRRRPATPRGPQPRWSPCPWEGGGTLNAPKVELWRWRAGSP